MHSLKIKDSTHNLGAPMRWDESKHGPCSDLHVRVKNDRHGAVSRTESAWKLTAEELAEINNGGVIILRVAGWQVPVALYVDKADRAEPINNDEPKS